MLESAFASAFAFLSSAVAKTMPFLPRFSKRESGAFFQLAAESRHFGCGVNVQNILAQKVSLKAAEIAHTVRGGGRCCAALKCRRR